MTPRASRWASLLDLTPAAARVALEAWVNQRGLPAYRVDQIAARLWRRPVEVWEDATDLPRDLRVALGHDLPLLRLALDTEQVAADGTRKFLWRLEDGQAVESVLIPEGRRRTLCISSQVGCALQCAFCATGRMGFSRNLSAGEIAGQVRELVRRGLRPTNVVYMGMGEPLLNWPHVDTSLTILNAPDGFGIGARRITVSTVGIIPSLARLQARPEQFRLALSLHAAESPQRLAMMPIEKKYPLEEVLHALEPFRRRITFEYVLMGEINDAEGDADALIRLARPMAALVNLLPLHPGGADGLEPATAARTRAFARRLRDAGVEAVVRRSRGLDIAAACGQLRVERGDRRSVRAEENRHVDESE